MTSFLRRRFWLMLGLSIALAAVILILMPGEKTLGWVIKIVYLHGALSRAGMVGLWAAGIAGAVYLIRPRPALARWTAALLLSGWGYWAAHFIVSMPATRLTWGPWVAWGEPRVTMTLQVLVAGLVVIVITRLLKDARFTAAAAILLAVAVAFLVGRTGVLRHPLDPIGSFALDAVSPGLPAAPGSGGREHVLDRVAAGAGQSHRFSVDHDDGRQRRRAHERPPEQ